MATAQTESKIIILLTDGENNAGEELPLIAADLAASENIMVHTSIALTGLLLFRWWIRERDEQNYKLFRFVLMKILLREVSARTGGKYFSGNRSIFFI